MPSTTLSMIFATLCLLSASRPLYMSTFAKTTADSSSAHATDFPGWARAPIPASLTPLALSPSETHFGQNFPGQIAAFSDGDTTWVVRWITQPTRKLHPAAHCLRASGFTVEPDPILAASDGTHWSASTARRHHESLRVHERIVDADGREFTDVSAWFWTALAGSSRGPWWCLTQIQAGQR